MLNSEKKTAHAKENMVPSSTVSPLYSRIKVMLTS